MHLLDNYTICPQTRYASHTLFYSPENGDSIELRGFLGAAFFAALIVDTDEGDARGIALDTSAERENFFLRYEREVRRDDWGYLAAEINQLRDNYVQIAVGATTLNDLCPNIRLLSLAMDLTEAYMRRLVLETFGGHIWDAVPWKMPFPQWLIDAARVETRRQRYLKTDWTDAQQWIFSPMTNHQSQMTYHQSSLPLSFLRAKKPQTSWNAISSGSPMNM